MNKPLSVGEAKYVGAPLSQDESDLVALSMRRPPSEWESSHQEQRPRKKQYKVSSSSPACKRIVAVLEAATEPMSGHQIAAAANITVNTFVCHLRRCLIDDGKIHIAAWTHSPFGPFRPLYSAGPLIGAAPRKPEKKDQLAREREWKKTSGYAAAQKAKRRLEKVARVGMLAYLTGVRT